MATVALPASPLRDPAWRERVLWTVAAGVLLLPLGWLAEFNPATLWSEASLSATRQFLERFFRRNSTPNSCS